MASIVTLHLNNFIEQYIIFATLPNLAPNVKFWKNSITFKKAKKTREKISGHKKKILKSKPHKPKMSLENFFYPV